MPNLNQKTDLPFLVLMLSFLCFLSGCALTEHRETRGAAEEGFREKMFQGEHFLLKGWLKRGAVNQESTLHVYIEGDGRAWQSRSVVSADPTPTVAMGLRLAKAHPDRDAVYYLARPGQYLSPKQRATCDPIYWTHARFAKEVIMDMNAAVSRAKALVGAEHVALYGYSGGGAIAVLLAAQRQDVSFLATVAGNLDHEFWTRLHGVTPLSYSLNPIDVVDRVRTIPQKHLAGGADKIVPASVAKHFCDALASDYAELLIFPDMGHEDSWERVWKEIIITTR